MQTTNKEAFDLMRKWMEEKSLIRLQAYLDKVAFSFNGRIVEVDEGGIRLFGENSTEVDLALRNKQVTFFYRDDRHITGEEKERFECTLGIFFNANSDRPVDKLEKVMLALRRSE